MDLIIAEIAATLGAPMDKLKTYAVPLVALVLLLIWVFVVKPMLDEGPGEDAAATDADSGEAGDEGGTKTDAKGDAAANESP